MTKVDVVGLIILKNGEVLAEKRTGDRKVAPGQKIIPGGHVEPDETFEQACERELEEELGLKCSEFEPVGERVYLLEAEDQLVHYFVCRDWNGEIGCKEAEEVFWIDSSELDELDHPEEKEVVKEFLKKEREE